MLRSLYRSSLIIAECGRTSRLLSSHRQLRSLGTSQPDWGLKRKRKLEEKGDKKCYISSDPLEVVDIRMSESGLGSEPPELAFGIFERNCERFKDRTALAIKRDGEWKKWNYQEYYSNVRKIAKAYIKLGLQPGEAVAILGHNSPEWAMSHVGSVLAGGIGTGVYFTSTSATVSFICEKAKARFFIVEDTIHLDKILDGKPISQVLPSVTHVVMWDDEKANVKRSDCNLMSFDELIKMGEDVDDEVLEEVKRNTHPTTAGALIFTSGTTGNPKGVILTHDNVTWTIKTGIKHFEFKEGCEVFCSFMPFGHIAGLAVDVYLPLLIGGSVYYAGKDALKGALVEDLREVKPTRFAAFPRVFEKIASGVKDAEVKSNFLLRQVIEWAKRQSLKHHTAIREGTSTDLNGSFQYRLAKKLVFNKIHAKIGLQNCTIGRETRLISGAAPISMDILKYLDEIDLPVSETFALTESGGTMISNYKMSGRKLGTVGRPVSGTQVVIAEDDEIVISGRNVFKGYLGEPEKTACAFTSEEGLWLRTGDQGQMDENGYFSITGRLKELIITSGGKNIAPLPIEESIKGKLRAIISQCIVIGDNRNYLTCLLSVKCKPDFEKLAPTQFLETSSFTWCRRCVASSMEPYDEKMETVEDFLASDNYHLFAAKIQAVIDEVNRNAESKPFMIRKWTFLPRDLSMAAGELGPTLKVKRSVVNENFKDIIDKLYK